MAGRPTIADLAKEAGVSVATIDRVLNGRAKVREETARRVYEAAHKIGYHAAALIGQRMAADLPKIRFGFVLHKEKQAFFRDMREAAEAAVRAATGVQTSVEFAFASSQAPSDYAALIEELGERCDAVAAIAVAHLQVTDAVTRLEARGIPCFALLNDFAQGVRQSYVGLNNLKIGRVAAHMLATATRQHGDLAIFVGGHRWHGHELRETGFRSYMREFAPQFRTLDALVNLETRQLTYEATLNLLERHPNLRGIYCAGGGMEGAIAALQELRKPGEVSMVVHELTPESRSALAQRYLTMAVATPLDAVLTETVNLMIEAVQNGGNSLPGQQFLEPQLYLPESV
ncbi:LacI family DNA-binding transcriptional regulator [Thalassococcus lentus]|uniref:LacI family DNA-binding transcriptional regulator n=1 Tax=Thalassococcus lentus TaxID=1210524 RepID=A0ABT4XXM0_9RHOB|nr:LacI family DNA-binding transcriptional regulator [Thalassococcus lentus]MDA7426726.1 LacI family DNA-binding transcriptional regulator [Thalassococcus lentus]